jgi:uncharacterized protein (DUF362 family)
MVEKRKAVTRRDFIKAGACLAAGGVMGMDLFGPWPARAQEKSRVVLIRNLDVLDGSGRIVPEVLESMLDRAVTVLLETPDPASAWEQLVKPADVVGIKSNVWGALPTPPTLEAAIQKRMIQVGVKEKKIAVDDRGVLKNPIFSHATALINARPLRTHHWSGLGTLIKNYIMFTPNPSNYHAHACEDLGSIWHLPQVKGKTRLNILVMLTPQFHGAGPHHFAKEFLWNYCGLIVSTDPVAADAVGAGIIQAKRNSYFGAEKPVSPPPLHIAAADRKFGLGNCRPERIQLVKIGSDQDILI